MRISFASVMFALIMILLSGCRREIADLAQEQVGPVSVHARTIERKIGELRSGMLARGITTGVKSGQLVRTIADLPVSERKLVAQHFMEEVDSLGRVEVDNLKERLVWLFNFQEILKSVDLCRDYLEDKEWTYRLYALCADRYREALADCRKMAEQAGSSVDRMRIEGLFRNYASDFLLFSLCIRKVYLESAEDERLPLDQYKHWKRVLDEKLSKDDAN